KEEITFRELYEQSQRLASVLRTEYGLRPKQKAAFLCRNNASLVRALFAVSRVGGDIYLLNPEISSSQLSLLAERHAFEFYFYDAEASKLINDSNLENKSIVTYHSELASVDSLSKTVQPESQKIRKIFSSNITVLTGGTTGEPKIAKRRASAVNF